MALFDDFFNSSRSPAVLGTAFGVFILLGFAVLLLLVTDERLIGWAKDPASEIRAQEEQIQSLHGRIESAQLERKRQGELARLAEDLKSVKTLADGLQPRITELQAAKSTTEQETAQVGEAWHAYREQYRTEVRAKAKGREIGRLELSDKTVYEPAQVLEVDAVGMQIRHSGGVKRIGWRLLPAEMQDHFQFDEAEMAQKIAAERGDQKQLNLGAGIADLQRQIQSRTDQIGKNDARDRQLAANLQALQSRQLSISQDIQRKGEELAIEQTKKLRNTERVQNELNALRNLQAALPGQIASAQQESAKLRDHSTKLRKEIAELSVQMNTLRQQGSGSDGPPADAPLSPQ